MIAKRIILGLVLGLMASPAMAQSLLISGGKVVTNAGPILEGGDVLIQDGRIAAVGKRLPLPAGGQRIDATADYAALGARPGSCHHCHTGRCPVGITTQDAVLEQRLQPESGARHLKNYLKTLTMELTTIARACGKQNVHHLEPEDLVALTVEAAAMARLPLAGTQWIPGVSAG